MSEDLPVIAILTPTKGREQHLKFQVEQMKQVNYPQDKIRWIITDTQTADGECGWKDITKLYAKALYVSLPTATPLGSSRNIGIQGALQTDAEYFFLQDDDDIICRDRFLKTIETFRQNPHTHLVGCSAVIVYNLRSQTLIRVGQFGPYHSLEPTLAFTRAYAETHQFDSEDRRGRLMEFLEKFKVPMVQMKAEDCCVIIGHNENTFDKYQLECTETGFNIEEKKTMLLDALYSMFDVPKDIRKFFEAAYKDDLGGLKHTLKADRFLNQATTQFKEGVMDKDTYRELKKYLSNSYNRHHIETDLCDNGYLRYTMLESVIKEMRGGGAVGLFA